MRWRPTPPGGDEGWEGRLAPTGSQRRIVGYLAGATTVEIERQKGIVGPALAALTRKQNAVFVVDLGQPAPSTCPPELFSVVRRARVRRIEVVVVEDVLRFAGDAATAARIAAILCDVGVEIREAGKRYASTTRDAESSSASSSSRPVRSAPPPQRKPTDVSSSRRPGPASASPGRPSSRVLS